MMNEKEKFMQEAIELSFKAIRTGAGAPFGAIVVKDGKIIARGMNRVTINNDPTAHAEVVAIREACNYLQTIQLTGCEIYSSCEPCPMCLGAIYWSQPDKIYFANTKQDAANAGFDDAFIYSEINLKLSERKFVCEQLCREDALKAFEEWQTKINKVHF